MPQQQANPWDVVGKSKAPTSPWDVVQSGEAVTSPSVTKPAAKVIPFPIKSDEQRVEEMTMTAREKLNPIDWLLDRLATRAIGSKGLDQPSEPVLPPYLGLDKYLAALTTPFATSRDIKAGRTADIRFRQQAGTIRGEFRLREPEEGLLNTIKDLGGLGEDTIRGLSTPENLAILGAMAFTGGASAPVAILAGMPKATEAAKILALGRLKVMGALVDAGFSIDQAHSAWGQFGQAMDSLKRGDMVAAGNLFASGVVQSVFSVLAGKGAVARKSAASSLRAVAADLGKPAPLESASTIAVPPAEAPTIPTPTPKAEQAPVVAEPVKPLEQAPVVPVKPTTAVAETPTRKPAPPIPAKASAKVGPFKVGDLVMREGDDSPSTVMAIGKKEIDIRYEYEQADGSKLGLTERVPVEDVKAWVEPTQTAPVPAKALEYPLATPEQESAPIQSFYPEAQKTVWMSPDEFLQQSGAKTIDPSLVAELKRKLQAGTPLDPLWMDSEGANFEGRHRAQAAKELGIEKVPVVQFDRSKIPVGEQPAGAAVTADLLHKVKGLIQPIRTQLDLGSNADLESLGKSLLAIDELVAKHPELAEAMKPYAEIVQKGREALRPAEPNADMSWVPVSETPQGKEVAAFVPRNAGMALSRRAITAIEGAATRGVDLPTEISRTLKLDKPPEGTNLPGYWTPDWQPIDQAALLVRSAMGSDFPHVEAKAIAEEIQNRTSRAASQPTMLAFTGVPTPEMFRGALKLVKDTSAALAEAAKNMRETSDSLGEEARAIHVQASLHDLANRGITVDIPLRDLGLLARFFGTATQQLYKIHPLAGETVSYMAKVVNNMARDTRTDMMGFHEGVSSKVRGFEFTKQLVDLLDNPKVNKDNLPADLPEHIKAAYIKMRDLFDSHRLRAIEARRKGDRYALSRPGMDQEAIDAMEQTILQRTPDDWGIGSGYWLHAFQGDWTVQRLIDVDDAGNPTYKPVDIGWRAVTVEEAIQKAAEYQQAHPDAELLVSLDTVHLGPNSGPAGALRSLSDEIRLASHLKGEDLKDAIKDVRDHAGALVYGPKRIARRSFGHAMERESNLPGWARTPEAVESYIVGMNRYIALVEARPKVLKLRNTLAALYKEAPALSALELQEKTVRTTSNLLARLDTAILALEGYPNRLESAIRNTLQRGWTINGKHHSFDPAIVDRSMAFITEVEALLKLGYSPISAMTNLTQLLINTYPVLGEKYTTIGISNAYSSRYSWLIDELGIEAQSTKLETEGVREYMSTYKRLINPDASRGRQAWQRVQVGYELTKDVGMWMFNKAESTNRRSTAIGAYEKGLSMGLDKASAIEYARDIVNRTQFLFHGMDVPTALKALPVPIRQFKTFALKQFEFLIGLRGKELARLVAAMGLVGFAGLPGFSFVSKFIEWATGLFMEEGFNPREQFVQHSPAWLSRGVPGALGGDITRNVGFSEWFMPNTFDMKQLAGPASSDLYGLIAWIASSSTTREGEQAKTNFLRGISPEARRVADYFGQKKVGGALSTPASYILTDPMGRGTILKDLTPYERALMLLGVSPTRVVEESDTHHRLMTAKEKYDQTKGYYVDKVAEIRLKLSDPAITQSERAGLISSAIQLERESISKGITGVAQGSVERARQLRQERLQRDVRKSPRPIRKEAEEQRKELIQ